MFVYSESDKAAQSYKDNVNYLIILKAEKVREIAAGDNISSSVEKYSWKHQYPALGFAEAVLYSGEYQHWHSHGKDYTDGKAYRLNDTVEQIVFKNMGQKKGFCDRVGEAVGNAVFIVAAPGHDPAENDISSQFLAHTGNKSRDNVERNLVFSEAVGEDDCPYSTSGKGY